MPVSGANCRGTRWPNEFTCITYRERPVDNLATRFMFHALVVIVRIVPFVFQAYHSQYNSDDNRLISNLALLPVRTNYKGPAPKTSTYPVALNNDHHVHAHSMLPRSLQCEYLYSDLPRGGGFGRSLVGMKLQSPTCGS